jgi:hypothetical protein
MDSLSHVLEEALRRMGGAAGLEARAVLLWPEVAGSHVARATEVTGAPGGVLLVTTRSEAWSTELSLMKPVLLARYRTLLGREFLRDLRCRVGRVRGALEPQPSPAPPAEELRRIALPRLEVERIAEAAASTEDPELSQAIRRALTREAQLRRWLLARGGRACPGCGTVHQGASRRCPACRTEELPAPEAVPDPGHAAAAAPEFPSARPRPRRGARIRILPRPARRSEPPP